jgi:hypothetical protein
MRERDLSAMSKQYSSRDLPSHTALKSREKGQGTVEELKEKDFRRELEEREKLASRLITLSVLPCCGSGAFLPPGSGMLLSRIRPTYFCIKAINK